MSCLQGQEKAKAAAAEASTKPGKGPNAPEAASSANGDASTGSANGASLAEATALSSPFSFLPMPEDNNKVSPSGLYTSLCNVAVCLSGHAAELPIRILHW